MINSKSVTIKLRHLHPTLQDAILNAESNAGETVRLLNELVQLRLDRASTGALEENLGSAQVTIEGLREAAEQRKKEIAHLKQQVHNLKSNIAAADTKRTDDLTDTRTALDHAIELIVYLKDRANDY
jgi:predicted  nucleic acid-binding Zn-ribbon protein